ncbi:MAG: dTDP-4-dehydrorhamnose 3,5-epimerase family protein, partial [Terriglobia bacterium]
VVRCTAGAIYDVVLDLRPQSPTFKGWVALPLTAEKRNMVYVPEGCAHGFLTLEAKTEVFYQMTEFYSPESARGVRWDDRAFGIAWPERVEVISERDRNYPNFE